MPKLRDGSHVDDPRLDRLVQFDERSRDYPIRAAAGFSTTPRNRTWALPLRLDQGREGACTGFARSHDLASVPKPAKGITDATAQDLYVRARRLDEWPGEDYDGSSVLGAVKAAAELGYVGEYRWAFGIDDVLGALSSLGPVVFGTPWLDSMFDPRPDGTMDCTGKTAGGHSFIGRGVGYPLGGKVRRTGAKDVKSDVPLVRITNSWGAGWGIGGDCFIRADDLSALLKDDGEAAVTTVAYSKPT